MAVSGAIRAARAYVELFADSNPLTRGLKGAQQQLQSWGNSVTAIGKKIFSVVGMLGAGGLTGIAATAKAFGDMGGELVDLSGRTGMTVEAIQELGHAAAQTGAETADLEVGIKKMQDTIVQAGNGSKQALATLESLGISFDELREMTPDQQLERFADAIADVQNPALKTSLAMDVFGKAGTKLLPMLNEGGDGIREFRAEARELGIVASGDAAAAADDFGDSLATLWKQIKMGAFNIGSAFLPELQQMVSIAQKVTATVVTWIRENKDLIVTTAKIIAAVVAAGAVIYAVGVALTAAGAACGMLSAVASGVVAAFGTVIGVFGALLSPIGLVVAAVAALGTWWAISSGKASEAIDWLKSKFQELLAEGGTALEGIRNALAAGDLGLAMRVAGAFMNLEWQKALHALKGYWIDFKEFFLRTWTEATFGLSSVMTNAWAGLRSAWQETVDFFADAWTAFTAGFFKAFNSSVGFVMKAWAGLKSLFDSEMDLEGEQKRIDQETVASNAVFDDERDQKIFERQKARQKELQAIEAERLGALQELDAERQRRQDALGEDFEKQRQESLDNVARARVQLDHIAKEAANNAANLGNEPGGKIKGVVAGADELEQHAAAEKKGIGFVDVRSAEGFKSVLASLRAANDPSTQIVKNTAKSNDIQSENLRENKRIREAVEDMGGNDFRGAA